METLDENSFGKNEISAAAVDHLRSTYSWMKLIGILGIIGSVLGAFIIVLGSFFLITLGSSSMTEDLFPLYFFSTITTIGIFGTYIYASVQLLQAGNNYELYVMRGESIYLEVAFRKQRQFWLIVGIVTIIMLCLYTIIIFANVMFA